MALVLALSQAEEREFLGAAFQQVGYIVKTCADAGSIIPRVLAEKADLVVVDTCLKNCDIEAICAELAHDRAAPGIVVIGEGLDAKARARLFGLGVDDVIERPFDAMEFVARVEALLRRVARVFRNLQAGRICVLERERTAFVDAVSVDLTEREWRLLRYLVRRADRTVTRAELLAKLWPSTQSPGSNVVDVHIAHLRQKLGDAGRNLRCVRGVGYRLEVAGAQ